jgi:hypothetical protein
LVRQGRNLISIIFSPVTRQAHDKTVQALNCQCRYQILQKYITIFKLYQGAQTDTHHLGVKVFNALPSDIKTEFNNP